MDPNKAQFNQIQCTGPKIPCETCKGTEWVNWNINQCDLCSKGAQGVGNNKTFCLSGSPATVVSEIYQLCSTVPDLEGIMFDDESGDPTYTVQALEQVKKRVG